MDRSDLPLNDYDEGKLTVLNGVYTESWKRTRPL